MKRSLISLMATSLLLGASVVFADGTLPPGEFCNAVVPLQDVLTQDTCVVCRNGGNNTAVCVCKILQDRGTLDDYGIALGDCVSWFKSEAPKN